jgi:general secretion pathway protein H
MLQNLLRNRLAPAGFTLVELLVVMAILMIAAAIVIPQAVGTSSFKAQSAARLAMSDLEYAQNQAIVVQSPVKVQFSPAGNSYTILDVNKSQPLVHPITKKVYTVDFATQAGLKGVSLDSADFGGAAEVTFDSLGAPDRGGTVTVSAGVHAYRVTVAPVSGRVKVEQVP